MEGTDSKEEEVEKRRVMRRNSPERREREGQRTVEGRVRERWKECGETEVHVEEAVEATVEAWGALLRSALPCTAWSPARGWGRQNRPRLSH